MINREELIQVNIESEMRKSFLDYSMSVIVGRALPDSRDGLKPVHRRVLYGLHTMGLYNNRPFRKSAKIVGEVMGNLHPHGDSAIYDTMVRMAQDFSLRYPLISGQGNFGSVDGDPPAAMRYTEAKMAKIASEMLSDIDKNTVDFVPNYDESMMEPTVLPSALPNLLVNGSSGIAVGMATNIPPHNLKEIIDALIHMIDNPDPEIEDLIKIVQGPDFPTGGYIIGRRGIESAFRTGRGRIRMRARAVIEVDEKSGKEKIIITEIPYQVNKANLLETIASLVRAKKLEGISALGDESDRDGMRIVIEVKRKEMARVLLNKLYARTQLQDTFGVIMLALVNGRPQVLNLKQALNAFLQHRRSVIQRRTQFLLEKAEKRAHIIEGLLLALNHIDEVIAVIKASSDVNAARLALIERFGLSVPQANAILEMRLQKLTGLERDKLQEEYRDLLKEIARYKAILESESLLMSTVKTELMEIRTKYGDDRRTEILPDEGDIDIEDMITTQEMVVFVTNSNYIKRTALSTYRAQKRRGQGSTGMAPKEGDYVEQLFVASTHDYLMVFTNRGKVYSLKVYRVPETGRAGRGNSIANLLNITNEEKIQAVLPVPGFVEDKNLIMVTRNGTIKKTPLKLYISSIKRAGGIIALRLKEEDELIAVRLTTGDQQVLLATHHGKAIRFREKDVRAMGRASAGVRGIQLQKGDVVVGMIIVSDSTPVLTVTEYGYGKRTLCQQYRLQKRGGLGVKNIRTSKRNGSVVGVLTMHDDNELLMITNTGRMIRMVIDMTSLRLIGRDTQGVKLQDLAAEEHVVAIARFMDEEAPQRTC